MRQVRHRENRTARIQTPSHLSLRAALTRRGTAAPSHCFLPSQQMPSQTPRPASCPESFSAPSHAAVPPALPGSPLTAFQLGVRSVQAACLPKGSGCCFPTPFTRRGLVWSALLGQPAHLPLLTPQLPLQGTRHRHSKLPSLPPYQRHQLLSPLGAPWKNSSPSCLFCAPGHLLQ